MTQVQRRQHAAAGRRRQHHRHRLGEETDPCDAPAVAAVVQFE
jgi:hypothetical protein